VKLKNENEMLETKSHKTIHAIGKLFSDFSTDEDSHLEISLPAIYSEECLDLSEEEPEPEVFEDLGDQVDLSRAPKWFEEMEVEAKSVLQDKVELNLEKGKIPDDIREEMIEIYNFTNEQVDELVIYFLMKQGEDHDQDMIFEFHEEMGITADDEPFKGMDKVIDMQRRIVEIESHLTVANLFDTDSTNTQDTQFEYDEELDSDQLPPLPQAGSRLPSSIKSFDNILEAARKVDTGELDDEKKKKPNYMATLKGKSTKRKKLGGNVKGKKSEFEAAMEKARKKSVMSKHPPKNAYLYEEDTPAEKNKDDLRKHESLLGDSKFSTLNSSELSKCSFRDLRMYAKKNDIHIPFGVTKAKIVRIIIDDNLQRLEQKVAELEEEGKDPSLNDPLLVIGAAAETILKEEKSWQNSIILTLLPDLQNRELAALLQEAWKIRDVLKLPTQE